MDFYGGHPDDLCGYTQCRQENPGTYLNQAMTAASQISSNSMSITHFVNDKYLQHHTTKHNKKSDFTF